MQKIRTDHVVRSADGTLYRVRYVHEAGGTADLADLEHDAHITLPLGELRRVPDPFNRKPPIEGLPPMGERPRCQWCNKVLRHTTKVTYSKMLKRTEPHVLRRVWDGWSGYERSTETYTVGGQKFYLPLFHTTGCAIKFAGASWRGGFRRTTTK